MEKPKDEFCGAVKVAEPSALQLKAGEFIKFAELSVKLQHMIWRAFIQDPVIIGIPEGYWDTTIQRVILLATKKSHPALQICYSSRWVATHEKREKRFYKKSPRKTRYVWFDPNSTLLFDRVPRGGIDERNDAFWDWYPGMKPDWGFRACAIKSLAFKHFTDQPITSDFDLYDQSFSKIPFSKMLPYMLSKFFNLKRVVFCQSGWMIAQSRSLA